jgi:hypothetical protein
VVSIPLRTLAARLQMAAPHIVRHFVCKEYLS